MRHLARFLRALLFLDDVRYFTSDTDTVVYGSCVLVMGAALLIIAYSSVALFLTVLG